MSIATGTLCVRQDNGRYRPIAEEEVCQYVADILLNQIKGTKIDSPLKSVDFLKAQLGLRKSEVFGVVWLDTRHRVIEFKELFHGTIDGASVHPREVVRCAIGLNAAAVILTHNHPSGCVEPSQADIRITMRLKEALGLIDVRVIDHIVIGTDAPGYASFAERGLL